MELCSSAMPALEALQTLIHAAFKICTSTRRAGTRSDLNPRPLHKYSHNPHSHHTQLPVKEFVAPRLVYIL